MLRSLSKLIWLHHLFIQCLLGHLHQLCFSALWLIVTVALRNQLNCLSASGPGSFSYCLQDRSALLWMRRLSDAPQSQRLIRAKYWALAAAAAWWLWWRDTTTLRYVHRFWAMAEMGLNQHLRGKTACCRDLSGMLHEHVCLFVCLKSTSWLTSKYPTCLNESFQFAKYLHCGQTSVFLIAN